MYVHFDINVTLFQYIFTTIVANRTKGDNTDEKMNILSDQKENMYYSY